jgi:L-iditol 2-dehydrogenase
VDAAIEIAGEDDAIEAAIALARPAGTVVVAGIPAGDHSTVTASIARRKGLDLRFSRRMNRVYPRAIALVEAGLVDVSSLVSHQFAMTDFDPAFRTAVRRDGHKVVILPSAASDRATVPARPGAPSTE